MQTLPGPLQHADPPAILALDAGGYPRRWIGLEEAATCYVRGAVAWDLGDHAFVLRGGVNRATGRQSELTLRSIVALRGDTIVRAPRDRVPVVVREMLFARDRHVCAYCGGHFRDRDLSRDHVVPLSRGGADRWMNVVTACRACNSRKDNRSPEAARMPLLYLPYVPSRHEHLILQNRRILSDQMDYLMARVPRTSRLHA